MLDQIFADLATGFAEQFGAPFVDGVATWQGTATRDAGGSITAPGTPASYTCKVQFDAATQAMRAAEGFLETDVRLIVLAASLARTLDSEAVVSVGSGQYAGTWALLSCTRDPAGVGYECRARRIYTVPEFFPPELEIAPQGNDW